MARRPEAVVLLLALCSIQLSAPCAAAVAEASQLTRLSVEELAELKVVTVSGRPERTSEVSGAVYVVTAEDIRASGVATIPDALRLAPGLQAARIDADEWAVAIRGFASRLSRSVLVLMDGRSLWSPLFAGVFWDAHDTLLEDVDQIEVSRGPGGAVWGANAFNGVIDITTKSARDTHGGLATLGAGNAARRIGLRWGGQASQALHYRVYGKHALHDGTRPVAAAGYDDEFRMTQGGFRLDWRRSRRDAISASGDLYDGRAHQPASVVIFTPPFTASLPGDADFNGGNLVTRWHRGLANGGELTARVYYDHVGRHEPHFRWKRDTFDVDLQHRFRWGGRHDTLWGVDYRRSDGRFDGVPSLQILPPARIDDIAGVFANDEARFAGGRLRLTLGTKLEWNDYSGWNVQPCGRLAWVEGRHAFWGSLTRALRTSSRLERDVVLYTSLSAVQPLFARAVGTKDFKPEGVLAVEGGYRLRLARWLLAASAFRNAYDDLATTAVGTPFREAGAPPEPVRTVLPVTIENGPTGTASGIEVNAVFAASDSWRVQGSYSYLKLSLDGPAGATFKSNSPRHQLWVASYLAHAGVELNLVFRAVGEIAGHQTPAYRELDAKLAYRPWSRLEVAAIGNNLLHSRHEEFGGGFAVERSGRLQATLLF